MVSQAKFLNLLVRNQKLINIIPMIWSFHSYNSCKTNQGGKIMLFKSKPEYNQVYIYNYCHALQSMNLLYKGENLPKEYKHQKKIWTGIDKRRKIKTIILGS